jgi:hypothetical protein
MEGAVWKRVLIPSFNCIFINIVFIENYSANVDRPKQKQASFQFLPVLLEGFLFLPIVPAHFSSPTVVLLCSMSPFVVFLAGLLLELQSPM